MLVTYSGNAERYLRRNYGDEDREQIRKALEEIVRDELNVRTPGEFSDAARLKWKIPGIAVAHPGGAHYRSVSDDGTGAIEVQIAIRRFFACFVLRRRKPNDRHWVLARIDEPAGGL